MSPKLFDLLDRLDDLFNAYESLQVLSSGDFDSKRVCDLLSVVNPLLESSLCDLRSILGNLVTNRLDSGPTSS